MTLLTVDDIHTYYGESHILAGVSLEVDDGETVAIIGRNGVGKTTTLRSVLQLTPPRSGRVSFEGETITGRRPDEVAGMGVGWIPEDRRMFSQLTVAENIRLGVPAGESADPKLDEAFTTFPDLERFQDRKAGTLSGGQQQMLAIARGLAGDNKLLLVDEPSEGLAPQIVETVAESLRQVAEDTTVLLVEQNFPLAMDLADRFYLIDHGQVVEQGSTEAVSRDDERIRRYLSA